MMPAFIHDDADTRLIQAPFGASLRRALDIRTFHVAIAHAAPPSRV
jgi:hypothetical protein